MINLRPSRWNWERILFARHAPVALGFAAVLSILAVVLIYSTPSFTSSFAQVLLGISGVLGAFGVFALLIPMWFFWLRCDIQPPWRKSIWFFLLLFGITFGAIPYFATVYLPAVRRYRMGEVGLSLRAIPESAPPLLKIGLFGKLLIASWALLFLTVAVVFTFPKTMSHVLNPAAEYFVLWLVALLITSFSYGVGMALRIGLRRGQPRNSRYPR